MAASAESTNIEALLAQLDSPNSVTRERVISRLAELKIDTPEVIAALERVVAQDEDVFVARAAREALQAMGQVPPAPAALSLAHTPRTTAPAAEPREMAAVPAEMAAEPPAVPSAAPGAELAPAPERAIAAPLGPDAIARQRRIDFWIGIGLFHVVNLLGFCVSSLLAVILVPSQDTAGMSPFGMFLIFLLCGAPLLINLGELIALAFIRPRMALGWLVSIGSWLAVSTIAGLAIGLAFYRSS